MKPKPLASVIVCSRCGLPWEAHQVEARKRAKRRDAEPTSDDCVTVLLAENKRLKANQRSYPQFSGSGFVAYPNNAISYGEFSGFGSIT